eukprot:TRINITY_DN4338_c0_g1_i2.p1 TRINITY_DN4338_c0_g1~~TRINITY_DN4338_c0_g1_i2.p1  ORF type:complete len:284 (-),score=73.66 TRINITY_DN4338_c0_g1_i2:96-947(-)
MSSAPKKGDKKVYGAIRKRTETPIKKKVNKVAPKSPVGEPTAVPNRTPVPEVVLRRRKTAQLTKERRIKDASHTQKVRNLRRRVIFKRAEQYVKEYRGLQQHITESKKIAKRKGDYYVEPEAKLAFVIRIRGINGLSPKPRKILQLLRLLQLNNGVFVRINGATTPMLKLVEPYVTYGYPSLKTVRDLIYKRGFAKVNGSRIPIHDNDVIQKNLGKYGILSIEDVVHEIYTVGKHFKEVSNFLWPFKLNNPTGGWIRKLSHWNEGGDAGNREKFINQLVHKMN